MKICYGGKDGGPESTCWGFWLVEIKAIFSAALLKFVGDSREAFHSHAFNSVSWILRGQLVENFLGGGQRIHKSSWHPVFTIRDTFHKVDSIGTTWVLTFRGPWTNTWQEFLPLMNRFRTLTHGRKDVA